MREIDPIDAYLDEYETVLGWLKTKGVVSFVLSKDGHSVIAAEECDEWHYLHLSKQTMTRLIAELTELRDRME